ncbi:MAG TPA: hypothetical protein VH083_03155 [Myxococcales bacterium]|jgi:hypothetical protein|nr:hypothetical protein [Myxococcales bacterium]
MTTLGKKLFAFAAAGLLVAGGLALRAERAETKPAAVELTPEQRTEIFQAQTPPPPKAVPAVHYEEPAPTPGLTPEDGEGS